MARDGSAPSPRMAARRAVQMLGDFLSVMERASDQVALGIPPEQVDVGSYQIYVASQGRRIDDAIDDATDDAIGGPDDDFQDKMDEAVLCAWSVDDYFNILSAAASDVGLSLEDSSELLVTRPEAEFEENMVTGWFHAWRGVKVDLGNRAMDDLVEIVGEMLQRRGLAIVTLDEDVIFRMPVRRRSGQELGRGSGQGSGRDH